MNKYLILIFFWALTACDSFYEKDESSLFYSISTGSSLVLNQPLTIPPNKASVVLQKGKIVEGKGLDIYYANCRFEVKTLSDKAITVKPDTFTIYKIIDEQMSVSLETQMFASLDLASSSASGNMNYATVMYLESKRQPDVLKMVCTHWEAVSEDNYLSIKQMRQAMGEIFTLKLAE